MQAIEQASKQAAEQASKRGTNQADDNFIVMNIIIWKLYINGTWITWTVVGSTCNNTKSYLSGKPQLNERLKENINIVRIFFIPVVSWTPTNPFCWTWVSRRTLHRPSAPNQLSLWRSGIRLPRPSTTTFYSVWRSHLQWVVRMVFFYGSLLLSFAIIAPLYTSYLPSLTLYRFLFLPHIPFQISVNSLHIQRRVVSIDLFIPTGLIIH